MTIRWNTAKDAANAARRLPHVHGSQARFEPDITPAPGDDPFPVSTHTVIRVEAWPGPFSAAPCPLDMTDAVDAVEADLAALPGAFEHGHVYTGDPLLKDSPVDRRPYAWALLHQDDGPCCSHTRERWSKGAIL
jgi:hypothetical protein